MTAFLLYLTFLIIRRGNDFAVTTMLLSHLPYFRPLLPRFLSSRPSGKFSILKRNNGLNELRLSVDGLNKAYLFNDELEVSKCISKDFPGIKMENGMIMDNEGNLLDFESNPRKENICRSRRPAVSLYESAIRSLDELIQISPKSRSPPAEASYDLQSEIDVGRARSMAIRASRLRWTGLGLMGFQFGFLFELIWKTYSWDIMEPVTYFVTFTTGSFAAFCYFILFKHDYEYSRASNLFMSRTTSSSKV